MNHTTLIDKLKAIIAPYAANKQALSNLNETTDFINDLEINSANLVDVILDIEEVFDIRINNEEMEQMLTVKAAVAIIERKLAEK